MLFVLFAIIFASLVLGASSKTPSIRPIESFASAPLTDEELHKLLHYDEANFLQKHPLALERTLYTLEGLILTPALVLSGLSMTSYALPPSVLLESSIGLYSGVLLLDLLQFLLLRSTGKLRQTFCTGCTSLFNGFGFLLSLILLILLEFWSDFGGLSTAQTGILCAAAQFSLMLTIGKLFMSFEKTEESSLKVELIN